MRKKKCVAGSVNSKRFHCIPLLFMYNEKTYRSIGKEHFVLNHLAAHGLMGLSENRQSLDVLFSCKAKVWEGRKLCHGIIGKRLRPHLPEDRPRWVEVSENTNTERHRKIRNEKSLQWSKQRDERNKSTISEILPTTTHATRAHSSLLKSFSLFPLHNPRPSAQLSGTARA